jgi:hypothetical protein
VLATAIALRIGARRRWPARVAIEGFERSVARRAAAERAGRGDLDLARFVMTRRPTSPVSPAASATSEVASSTKSPTASSGPRPRAPSTSSSLAPVHSIHAGNAERVAAAAICAGANDPASPDAEALLARGVATRLTSSATAAVSSAARSSSRASRLLASAR